VSISILQPDVAQGILAHLKDAARKTIGGARIPLDHDLLTLSSTGARTVPTAVRLLP